MPSEPNSVPSERPAPHALRLLDSSPQERAGFVPLAWIAAVLAAGFGATVWASLAWLTNREIGYVAWGIGAGIGLAARRTGGRGVKLGAFAALLALAAIFTGKVVTVRVTPHLQAFEMSGYYTEELYQTAVRDAATIAELAGAAEEPPSYGEWRLQAIESDRAALADFSAVRAVIDGLGPIDLIFALLGISTAFGLIARKD